MISILITDVFAVYGILRELRSDSSMFDFLLIANSMWIFIQYLIKLLMAYAGSSTTQEAEKTVVLVTKLIIQSDSNKELKTNLNYFLVQMQARKKSLETIFFIINWNLILTVSFPEIKVLNLIKLLFSQVTSTVMTYIIITSQLDMQ